MDLAANETVLFQAHPSWRSTVGYYIKGLLIAAVIAALVGAVSRIAGDEVEVAWVVVAFIVIFGAMLLAGWLKKLSTEYTVTTQRVHVRRGLITRKTEETRIDRIQNANTSQTILQRMLRVGTVDFDVASQEREGLFRFEGVANPREVVRAVNSAHGGGAARRRARTAAAAVPSHLSWPSARSPTTTSWTERCAASWTSASGGRR